MQDLISVVVPVYNCGPYLDACLTSLQAQTWQNWEGILVDDGSTDGSGPLCDAWAQKDSRFRVFHQKNSGVSAARNAGIDAARGKYLAFLDADDRVEPEFLQVLRQTMEDTDLGVCCVFDPSHWNEKVWQETVTVQTLRTTPSQYANPVYTNYLYNKLYRLDSIRGAVRFPVSVRRCEDAYFVQDYLLRCRTVGVTTQKLYHYDQHEGSAMHRFYAGVCDDEIPLMQRQYDLFHPDGPNSLSKTEETAFWSWQYGKVLGILRYIVQYAPDYNVCKAQVRRLLETPLARQTMLAPPVGTGKKAKLAALLLRLHAWDALIALLKGM